MLVSQMRARRRAVASPTGGVGPSPTSGGTLIPYDYAARVELKGRPGNVVQDVIAISPDSVFVAVAIGYGFEQHRVFPLEVSWQGRQEPADPAASGPIPPAAIQLRQLPATALIEGFRLSPAFENVMFRMPEEPGAGENDFSDRAISRDLTNYVFERVRLPVDISFLFSLVDSSSGRELQDEPIHNLAGLGKSTGERPFRPLAQPLSFLPRSTIRVQVIERTPDVTGTLFIVLYGYKIWTGAACPEPAGQALAEAAVRRGWPSVGGSGVIPFDYVAKFELTGRQRNHLEDEITISTEGAFVATSLGYGLAIDEEGVTVAADRAGDAAFLADNEQRVNLAELPLRAFPPSALRDGIRIRSDFLRIAMQPGGALSTDISMALANMLFERVNRSEDVSFRYTIYDSGTGQGWQNMPLNNVAGLGISNGQRPFKRLARPMVFRPRSTLRLTVDEHFGRGWLYFAFQGYKVLGTARGGAA